MNMGFCGLFYKAMDKEPTDVTITIVSENADGKAFKRSATAAEWFSDWMGECELCPPNDAPVRRLWLKTGSAEWASQNLPENFEVLMEAIRPTMVYHHWGDQDEDYIETAELDNAEPRYFIGKENAIHYISQHDVPFSKAVECVGICPECGQPVFPARFSNAYAYCHHCNAEWLEEDLV